MTSFFEQCRNLEITITMILNHREEKTTVNIKKDLADALGPLQKPLKRTTNIELK